MEENQQGIQPIIVDEGKDLVLLKKYIQGQWSIHTTNSLPYSYSHKC